MREGLDDKGISLGDRMKGYEGCFSTKLPRRVPVIVRVDGKAFHTFTRRMFGRGYSEVFVEMMSDTAKYLQKEIQGCDFCYVQSDEISLLLTDYRTIKTDAWFGNEVNKIVSVSAALASSSMSLTIGDHVEFDSRAFSCPQDEVCNYFIWRQQDATRNAIQMAGQEYFSHSELNKKSCSDIQEMLFSGKAINFNDYPTVRKRGLAIVSGNSDSEIPIFSEDRNYIDRHVFIRED